MNTLRDSSLRHRLAGVIISTAVIVGTVEINVSATFAQGTKAIRTAHSRERTKEFINDFANPLGFDDGTDRAPQAGRRRPTGQQQIDPAALRQSTREFADRMAQLTYAINDQMGQSSGLKQIYTEALRLSGVSAAIEKRIVGHSIDGALLDDLQQLDADWREFAYRLENFRDLSTDAIALAKQLNDLDHSIRQLIGIQPQLDRKQLQVKVAGLVADLDNLQDDIGSELGRSQDAQAYRRSLSRVRQTALNLVSLVRDENSDNNVIVEQYKQFENSWTPLVAKLQMEDDRYIERGVRRVAVSVNQIHQLLLLPRKSDQSQFVYLAKSLKKDIDEFFERTPLILVMRLPNAKQALPAADQFYGACAQFIDVVNRSHDQNAVVDAFRAIDQSQRAFNDVYREIDSDRALAVLNRIAQSTDALRSTLQIQRDDFDYQTAADLGALAQNLSEQIAESCKHWFEVETVPFANNCMAEAVNFAELLSRLHDDLVDGKRPPELKDEVVEAYERCRHLYDYLAKCQTEDRNTLVRLSGRLTPALSELRSMILQYQ